MAARAVRVLRAAEEVACMAGLEIGRRVSLRHRLPGRSAPSGRPLLNDVVGVVVSVDADTVTVRTRDGAHRRVVRGDLVAVRPLAAGGPPRRLTGEQLQRVTADGWPAQVSEPLGEWLLRAAGGFTGRANSACASGDPGMATDEALRRVAAFYAHHGLPARVQVVRGSRWDTELTDAGWRPGGSPGATVLTAPVDLALTTRAPLEQVPVHDELSGSWLQRYGRTADTEQAWPLPLVRSVLEGRVAGDVVGFARLDAGPGEPAAAIGRMALTGAWAGMACVEVDPARRGEGLARRVVQSLLEWARQRGGRWCWLQVVPDNMAAHALYESYGFTRHHAYRYLTAPA